MTPREKAVRELAAELHFHAKRMGNLSIDAIAFDENTPDFARWMSYADEFMRARGLVAIDPELVQAIDDAPATEPTGCSEDNHWCGKDGHCARCLAKWDLADSVLEQLK
jgi:hypothetical protein